MFADLIESLLTEGEGSLPNAHSLSCRPKRSCKQKLRHYPNSVVSQVKWRLGARGGHWTKGEAVLDGELLHANSSVKALERDSGLVSLHAWKARLRTQECVLLCSLPSIEGSKWKHPEIQI